MPYLELGGDLPLPRVLAAMMFPRDGGRREEFVELARRKIPLGAALHFGAVVEDSDRIFYKVLKNIQHYYMHLGHPFKLGPMAGDILLVIRRITEHHPEYEASVARAAFLLAMDVQVHGIKTIGGSKVPSHESSVRKQAWSRYLEVAHFWATYSWIKDHAYRLSGSGEEAVRVTLDALAGELDLFLAVAEDMRRSGEKHTTRAVDGAKREEASPAAGGHLEGPGGLSPPRNPLHHPATAFSNGSGPSPPLQSKVALLNLAPGTPGGQKPAVPRLWAAH